MPDNKNMKNIFLIGGTMGVGKTTVCEILKNKLSIQSYPASILVTAAFM